MYEGAMLDNLGIKVVSGVFQQCIQIQRTIIARSGSADLFGDKVMFTLIPLTFEAS